MRLWTAVILMSALLALPALAQENCADKQTTLNISAEAEVKAAPDIAMISAGVLTVSKNADAALKENAVQMNAVFTALKAAGVKDKDMQTSGITISPQYVYEQNKTPQITGYQASNNLNVVIRDLKKMGSVLDTLVAKGANQINGPTFSIENTDAFLDGARKEAVAKARKRAELYAEAAGLKIKRIVTMSESTNFGSPPRPMMAMAKLAMDEASAPSPVAKGEIGLSAQVNITYELTE